MMFSRALTLFLLSGSAVAFSPSNNGNKGKIQEVVNKVATNALTAGAFSAAVLLSQAPALAVNVNSQVIGTPLESKLAAFGAASYPVFNSISDLTPLADKFLGLIDSKVKAPDAADVAQKAVDGLLAIPDSAITEYKGVLTKSVYSGVKKDSCVSLNGWEQTADKFKNSAAVKSVDPAKMEALKKKFSPANSAVPIKNGNICLPGSVQASEKLWVAQAELTFSMPKEQASALIASIKKAGSQVTSASIATIVKDAEGVFSRSPEAIKMVVAASDVEPAVIATAKAATK